MTSDSQITRDSSSLDRRQLLRHVLLAGSVALTPFRDARSDEPEALWLDGKDVIDPHIHVIDPRHPGVPKLLASNDLALNGDAQLLARLLSDQMTESKTSMAMGMPGWSQITENDPLAINRTLQIGALLPDKLKLFAIGAADPNRSSDAKHMKRVEDQLADGKVKALKCYLGYLPFGPDHEARLPYYELAKKYKIPVIFHTGDTYSRKAQLKFAHPLGVDDVAVKYPEVRFVLAHLGNPWILDAAEVVYKNNQFGDGNVWADLSALFVSTQASHYQKTGILDDIQKKVRHAISFTERPDRFIYASDWPLNGMSFYRDFIKDVVPPEHHGAIFHDNAKLLFNL